MSSFSGFQWIAPSGQKSTHSKQRVHFSKSRIGL
jgi:hypothetical protein